MWPFKKDPLISHDEPMPPFERVVLIASLLDIAIVLIAIALVAWAIYALASWIIGA